MNMYDTFYELKKRPFSLMPDTESLYFSRSCRIALSLLELSVTNRVALSVLLGDEGIGKTSIVRHFVNQQPNEFMAGIVTAISGQTTEEFLGEVLEVFGVMELGRHQGDVLGRWNDLVAGNINDGRRRILIIDDAEHMSFETINILLGFLKKDSNDLDGIQIILSGHSTLTESFKYSHIDSWINAAGLSYRLQPLRRQETAEYIRYRLMTAGSERNDIFDSSGLDAIFDYSEGVPQRINFLCDSVLDYGRAEKEGVITRFWVDKTVEKWNESRFRDPIGKEDVGQPIIYEDSEITPAGDGVSAPTDDLIDANVFDTLSDPKQSSGENPGMRSSYGTLNTQSTDFVNSSGEFPDSPPKTQLETAQKVMIASFLLLVSSIIFFWSNFKSEDPEAPSSAALVGEETTLAESELDSESIADIPDAELSEIEKDGLPVANDEAAFSALISTDKDLGEAAGSRSEGTGTERSKHTQRDSRSIVADGSDPKKAFLNRRKEKQIEALLDRGDRQLRLLQLTYPEGRNAYETYSRILEIDSSNKRAAAGLRRVADKYLDMAEYYLAKERYVRSYGLIKKALAIVPQDKKLLDFEKKVARQIKR